MIDDLGSDQLTLAALAARLGVRQPSLYKHVNGLHDINRRIAIRTKSELTEVLGTAAIGRARDDALVAMAHAYRAWALEYPGRYEAAQRASAPGDVDDEAVGGRFIQMMAAVMAGYDLDGEDAIDAIRAVRAALHGFVSLETSGAFALPAGIDRSFDRLIHALVVALSSWSNGSESDRGTTAAR